MKTPDRRPDPDPLQVSDKFLKGLSAAGLIVSFAAIVIAFAIHVRWLIVSAAVVAGLSLLTPAIPSRKHGND